MASKVSLSPVERKTALCYIRKSWTFHVKEELEIDAESDTSGRKRKSKYDTDNTTEQISPERQRAHIQAICDANGWIPEWYEDTEKHKSGMHEKNRPGWLALKSRMRDSDVVAIVANDLARLHRKGWRIGDLLDFVDEHGIKLVIADPRRQIDFSTPYGRMFAQLSAIFDEWYALDISERRKADIAHRKSEGKTVGLPPFGTRRNREGYLVATQEGAWLLPDGTWIRGVSGDEPPSPDAIWRGYYDCAYRILTLYVEQVGKGRILDKLHEEGWAFRDRDGNPSPLEREDIRRVISNFAEYGGYVSRNRARERHPTEFLADEIVPKFDPERAVFDVRLLAQVAYSRQARAAGRHPTRSVNSKARAYPLAGITYCAHCEQLAQKHNNPKLRSLLSGKLGKYYRHKPGVKCGTGKTMVTREKYEADFIRLVHLMELSPEGFDQLLELSDHLNPPTEDLQDAEAKKEQAIALCKRRIQAAIDLYGDGRITRQEYMRRVEQNEREIVSWRAKTTDREKLVMELSMCVQAIQAMTQMWSIATDEDKQGMARHLFDSITYDLGVEQIVDFKLKPWAEQFFTLRSGLYADERLVQGDGNPVALTGFDPTKLSMATACKLRSNGCWRRSMLKPLSLQGWQLTSAMPRSSGGMPVERA